MVLCLAPTLKFKGVGIAFKLGSRYTKSLTISTRISSEFLGALAKGKVSSVFKLFLLGVLISVNSSMSTPGQSITFKNLFSYSLEYAL
jgi:hypothetical protein